MTGLDRLLDPIDRLVRTLAMLATAAIIIVLLLQIFFRYVLNSSLVWSEEVGTWLMIWVVFIASAAVMRRWDHVHIPMFIRWMPLTVRPGAILIAKAATLACVLLVTWYGVQMVLGTFHMRSQATGISTRWMKLSVPIGMALMALFAGASLLRDVQRLIAGDLAHFARYGELEIGERPTSAVRTTSPDA